MKNAEINVKKTEKEIDKIIEYMFGDETVCNMSAAEKDFYEYYEKMVVHMFLGSKKSYEEVKNVIKKMNDKFYSLFGMDVHTAIKNPKLNIFVGMDTEFPFGEYCVTRVYNNIFLKLFFRKVN